MPGEAENHRHGRVMHGAGTVPVVLGERNGACPPVAASASTQHDLCRPGRPFEGARAPAARDRRACKSRVSAHRYNTHVPGHARAQAVGDRMTSGVLAVGRVLATIAVVLLAWAPIKAHAQTGAERFAAVCIPCHTIGGGRGVGPDLKGVNERRSAEWLLAYMTSPQKMISSGDPVAVQLHKEYTIVMPDFGLSPTEIREVLAYIASASGAPPTAPAAPQRAATPEDIHLGQDLFQGHVRLSNGGPACNSCHDVRNDAVIGGGILAVELTAVFGRVGASGIHAILGSPPFPVMQAAYRLHPLIDDEIFALVSFLKDADQHQAFQHPRDYGLRLFYTGLIGFAVLMALFALFGRRRRKHPVFGDVFERQIRTR
ncbi:MAG: cytochrome c [Acidobacteriota bacterium]